MESVCFANYIVHPLATCDQRWPDSDHRRIRTIAKIFSVLFSVMTASLGYFACRAYIEWKNHKAVHRTTPSTRSEVRTSDVGTSTLSSNRRTELNKPATASKGTSPHTSLQGKTEQVRKLTFAEEIMRKNPGESDQDRNRRVLNDFTSLNWRFGATWLITNVQIDWDQLREVVETLANAIPIEEREDFFFEHYCKLSLPRKPLNDDALEAFGRVFGNPVDFIKFVTSHIPRRAWWDVDSVSVQAAKQAILRHYPERGQRHKIAEKMTPLLKGYSDDGISEALECDLIPLNREIHPERWDQIVGVEQALERFVQNDSAFDGFMDSYIALVKSANPLSDPLPIVAKMGAVGVANKCKTMLSPDKLAVVRDSLIRFGYENSHTSSFDVFMSLREPLGVTAQTTATFFVKMHRDNHMEPDAFLEIYKDCEREAYYCSRKIFGEEPGALLAALKLAIRAELLEKDRLSLGELLYREKRRPDQSFLTDLQNTFGFVPSPLLT